MLFTKVSLTPPTDKKPWSVRLEWIVYRKGEDGEPITDERTLKSTDAPRPSFWPTLQALGRAVADACQLTPLEDDGEPDEGALGDLLDMVEVRGVTLKELEDGEALTITALRSLTWSPAPLVLNTPFALVDMLPTEDLDALLDELKQEAAAYVRGERLQPDLFGQGDGTGRQGVLSWTVEDSGPAPDDGSRDMPEGEADDE